MIMFPVSGLLPFSAANPALLCCSKDPAPAGPGSPVVGSPSERRRRSDWCLTPQFNLNSLLILPHFVWKSKAAAAIASKSGAPAFPPVPREEHNTKPASQRDTRLPAEHTTPSKAHSAETDFLAENKSADKT